MVWRAVSSPHWHCGFLRTRVAYAVTGTETACDRTSGGSDRYASKAGEEDLFVGIESEVCAPRLA
eukprot:2777702-Rhodomonas_salina.2